MSKLRLRLSGTFDAQIESHPLRNFRTAKARALLAYLAMEPNIPHSRQALSTLFWPDLDDKAAASNLRTTLTNFRRLFKPLPSLLTITRQTIELHSDCASVDMLEFADNPSLETIELYRGDFLSGLNLYDAIAFEEWRTMQQERLHMLALLTLDNLIEERRSAGDLTSANQLVHKQLRIEPWHEKAHYQYIRLLWVQGQREAALQQYEQCRALLDEELGIAPSLGLQNLVEEIKVGKQSLLLEEEAKAKQKKHNLPQQNRPFVGREVEIRQLMDQIDKKESQLISVVGTGGVGKSRFVIEAASRYLTQTQAFLDGLFFIPLAPIDDPDLIPHVLGEAVGYSFYEGTSFRDQILDFLQNRATLLIFDNFEHLAAGGTLFIRDLLESAPDCQIIVTSRHLLDLAEEYVFGIDGLISASREKAADLGDAERLYLLSAKRVSKSYDPSAKDLKDICCICQLVEGLPLAIVLAAGWINTLSAGEIADEIGRDIDFLASNQIDLPPRQRSLRATFAHTWWLLETEERVAYARLSIFRGGFTRRAAEIVTGATLRHLVRLVSKSLLIYDPKRNRYFIHELLRQVSEAELDHFGNETVTAVRDAHMAYYAKGVAAREERFQDDRQQKTLQDIMSELSNVRAAWRWATQTRALPSLMKMLEPLFLFFFTSGREQDGIVEFERTLELLAKVELNLEDEEMIFFQARLKNRLFELTHLYQAPESFHIESFRTLFTKFQADAELAILMHQEAMVALQQRDIVQAVSLFRQQASIYRASCNNFRLGATLTNLAQIFYIAGDLAAGRAVIEESLKLGRESGDRLTTGLSLIILGMVELLWIGDIEAARIRFHQMEEIGQTVRTRGQVITGFILSKVYLSFIHLLEGEGELATDYWHQVEALWAEKKTPMVNGMVAGLDSFFSMVQGRYAEAMDKAVRGLTWSSRPGAVELNQIVLVTAACMLQEYAHARAVLVPLWKHIVTVQKLPERVLLFYLLPATAALLVEDGQPEIALSLLTSGRAHKKYPKIFNENLELIKHVEERCKQILGEESVDWAIKKGKATSFNEIAFVVIPVI